MPGQNAEMAAHSSLGGRWIGWSVDLPWVGWSVDLSIMKKATTVADGINEGKAFR